MHLLMKASGYRSEGEVSQGEGEVSQGEGSLSFGFGLERHPADSESPPR